MENYEQFYINGRWVDAHGQAKTDVLNPANLSVYARLSKANQQDVDDAFAAASEAFPAWSATSSAEREALLMAVADEMENRFDDLIDAHVRSLGIPVHQAAEVQIEAPIEAVRYFASLAHRTEQSQQSDGMLIVREPVGVCALINPWNYPLLQMIGKVAPALAAGCTMVEKPSEETPTSDFIMAEIFDKVGLPAGVFNLISGVGSEIGPMMSAHPLADMVSFTGSNRAGVSVAECAAPSIKRVCQELGGKSALIITEDADLAAAVKFGVDNVFLNAGQTCDALTRMLVPASKYQQCLAIAEAAGNEHVVGDPSSAETTVGPLVSMRQKSMVDEYLDIGVAEGAGVLVGGPGAPWQRHCPRSLLETARLCVSKAAVPSVSAQVRC
ncbi:MAG: aldehyde dehydrogenase family protein, partial [Pseudomonadota bacterium]